MVGGRQVEDLGLDVLGLQLTGEHLRGVLPERRGLHELEVTDHQPLEVGQAEALQAAVRLGDGRVLAEDQVPLHLVAEHGLQGVVRRVRAGELGDPVETPVVLLRRVLAEVGLEQADGVGVTLLPETGLVRVAHRPQVVVEGLLLDGRHRQVTRQQVEQRRDVGAALDRRVTAQRHDAAAGATHVAQQQLEDRRGADELRAQGVLGPAQRVGEAGRALAAGVLRDCVGEVVEVLDGDAAGLLHHLRGVAGVVAAQDLEHRVRVLQRLVLLELPRVQRLTAGPGRLRPRRALVLLLLVVALPLRVAVGAVGTLVRPGVDVVLPGLRVEAGEQAVEVLGVLEVLVDERRGVRVVEDVVPEPQIVLDDMADEGTEQHDVTAGTDADVTVRHGGGARVARVDVDELGSALLRLHHPLESHRVSLGHV